MINKKGSSDVNKTINFSVWRQKNDFSALINFKQKPLVQSNYTVHLKAPNGFDTKAITYEVCDTSGKLVDDQHVSVKIDQDKHSKWANVFYDPDGIGPKLGWIVASLNLYEQVEKLKFFNTHRRLFSAAPDQFGPKSLLPTCVPCYPGLDSPSQAKMTKLPADTQQALAALKGELEKMVADNQGRPLEEFVFVGHGGENFISYETSDGKRNIMPADEALKVIVPFMANNGTILFSACHVAKGTKFIEQAKYITNPKNYDSRYAHLNIYASKFSVGNPTNIKEHMGSISTFTRYNNNLSRAISGLVLISQGEASVIKYDYKQAFYSGATEGVYSSDTFGF